MTTFLAGCITALFAVWIWTLKLEIGHLHERMTGENADESLSQNGVHNEARSEHAPLAVDHQRSARNARRDDGVPVWVIEG